MAIENACSSSSSSSSSASNGSTNAKQQRKRKLRNLCDGSGDNPTPLINENQRNCRKNFKYAFIFSMIAIVFAGFYVDSSSFFKDIAKKYRSHYTAFIRSKDNYCNTTLDTDALFDKIRIDYRILNQDEAFENLKGAFKTVNNFQSIAVVGPPGVGKHLFANALIDEFPWQQNVQSITWNTFNPDEDGEYPIIHKMLSHLSGCGFNLVVIRNLRPADKNVVTFVNEFIKNHTESMENKRLIVVYVFTLSTMSTHVNYLKSKSSLQKLPNTMTVNFREFNEEDLKECITREISLEKLQLDSSSKTFQELVNTIDVTISGCKNVHKKVLAFNVKN